MDVPNLSNLVLDNDDLTQVRKAINQGMALGNDRFKQEIEKLSGPRITSLRRGPKLKNGEFFI